MKKIEVSKIAMGTKTIWNYITRSDHFDGDVNAAIADGWVLENSGILSFDKPEETILYAALRKEQ